tara:strand:+ start:2517 stop:3125 length:609 start_codon:yes stop_codon:yes gene_type:complete
MMSVHGADAADLIENVRLEEAIMARALQCDRIRQPPDEAMLRHMLGMERDAGIPKVLRGITLAASCHEAGFNPLKEGDHKCSGEKGLRVRPFQCKDGTRSRARAVGLVQQWPWVETSPWGPKINRRNPYEATWAWIDHWVSKLPKVDKDCKPKNEEHRWVIAQVTSVRSPTPGRKARCHQESKHYKRFKRWRVAWEHLLLNG